MNYRNYLFTFLFIVYSSTFMVLNAQQHKIDSLYKVLKEQKDDTNKVNTLNRLSDQVETIGRYDASDSAARAALKLAESIDYKKGMASAYANIGYVYYDRSNYNEALKAHQQALSINLEIGNKRGIAASYSSIGIVYEDRGNYSEALAAQLKAIKLDEEVGSKVGLSADYSNIGVIYQSMGNYPEGLKAYSKALQIDQEIGDKQGVGGTYANIGNIYLDQQNYPEALKKEQQALEIDIEIGDKRGIGSTYGNLGDIYELLGNYPEALKNQLLSLESKKEIKNLGGISNAYRNIGSIYFYQKNYKLARLYIDSALALSKEIGYKEAIKDSYYVSVLLDSAAGDFKAAYQDSKYHNIYADSLSNEQNTKKVVQEQMQFDFDKKQAAEKAEQDKKDVLTASDKKRQTIITVAVSVVLLLVLLFSGLLLSRFKVTQKQKQVIEEQKALVEEKNKAVLDSITYAKRLQDAILPPMSVIKKYLPESFVLYKPKDIVAGDFYWMWSETTSRHSSSGEIPEQVVLIAAADCTGHGVPGAMVSVVCSNALNRAVKEFHITEPGKILDKTRELVLETFEKSEGDIKDGMDISLCCINTKTKEVQWSGAYNSLWYIHNEALNEVAADKQPIGKTDNPKAFTTRTLSLSHATLYLFTDGYADQFGGPKGKKFKYKQLSEKLKVISEKPMAEQKQILEETLESWKGSLEQVDDILIIGIRI